MSSKCESVSVPNETVLGLSDTWTGQIKASEKFHYLPEASGTEFWLVENKIVTVSVLVKIIATLQMTGYTRRFMRS